MNSSALSFSGTEVGTPEGNLRWLSFVAHEYFHLYNVKSIRPIALGPFDYDRPNRTRLLWISEGMTVYYEYIVLRRAGLMTPADVFKGLGSAIAGYENKPGHLVQSVAQSSFETWEQGPFGGDPDKSISYYDKGAGLGLLLDLKIRHESQGTKSLDDVMRTLYRDFFQEKKRGFTEREFREICERFAGVPLDEVFEYANTVKDIDYAKYLGYAGLEIDRPRELDEPAFGATFRDGGGFPVISRVERNAAADRAGLKSKDIILSVEGEKLDSQSLTARLNSKKPGDPVTISYSRDNQKGEAKVVLGKKMYPGFAITRIAKPDPRQEAIYNGWMKN
jgi:predicted metalloprotease with PDZ domain